MADTQTRAVVLGGGGLTGIAWLTGYIASLQEAGVPIDDADLILGTSAGSVVGAQLAAGRNFNRLYRFLGNDRVPARTALLSVYGKMPTPSPEEIERLAEAWHSDVPSSQESRIEAGKVARESRTMPERAWVTLIGLFLLIRHWPGPRLGVTVVDAETGEIRLLREDDHVPLRTAVAASAAVPQVFPPVHIAGRAYIDGGTGSVTNGDLAVGHDLVLFVIDHNAPRIGVGPLSRAAIDLEIDRLRAAGSEVVVVEPDAGSLEAIGELAALDPARIQPAARAGRAQGYAEAARIADVWPVRSR
jgi:NTE family protein